MVQRLMPSRHSSIVQNRQYQRLHLPLNTGFTSCPALASSMLTHHARKSRHHVDMRSARLPGSWPGAAVLQRARVRREGSHCWPALPISPVLSNFISAFNESQQ